MIKKVMVFFAVLVIFVISILIYFFVKFNPPLSPHDRNAKILDTLVSGIMERTHLPSALVGVFIPGDGEYIIVKGKSNLERKVDREAGQQYRIGSITKTFIATAVLQLCDSAKLNTSDKLSKWFPDFPNAEIITIKNLLMMRSGIYDSWDSARTAEYYNNPLMKLTAEDMIKFSAEKFSEFKLPDTETKYSNINYILLEKILEKVTGRKINDVIKNNICNPLGITNSIYETDSTLSGNLHGYSLNKLIGKFEDKTNINPDPIGGAGAMISNLSDLKIFAIALYKGTNLLKPETQNKRLEIMPMKNRPDFVGYGEGILKFGKFYGHNGTICGFSSEMYYLPEKDAVIVINVNRLDTDDRSKSVYIFQQVTKLLFPEYVNW